jgi:hypothetical protein
MANVVSMVKKIAVISALVEGCSVRSTVRHRRIEGRCPTPSGDTRTSLFAISRAKRVQVYETWSFCYAKQKNVTPAVWDRAGYAGDVWTFTAIDVETKLVVSCAVGRGDAGCAADFLQDVAGRLSNRIQLTTDGHKMYLTVVPAAFGNKIDCAQLVKSYGIDPEGHKRDSPAQCLGTHRIEVIGNPDQEQISTSYVERQNLNMWNQHETLYSADQCLLEEGRQSHRDDRLVSHALQLLQDSPDLAGYSGNGSWLEFSCLGNSRNRALTHSLRVAA